MSISHPQTGPLHIHRRAAKKSLSSAAASPAAPSAVIDRWDALMPGEDSFQRPPPQIGLSRGNGMDGVAIRASADLAMAGAALLPNRL